MPKSSTLFGWFWFALPQSSLTLSFPLALSINHFLPLSYLQGFQANSLCFFILLPKSKPTLFPRCSFFSQFLPSHPLIFINCFEDNTTVFPLNYLVAQDSDHQSLSHISKKNLRTKNHSIPSSLFIYFYSTLICSLLVNLEY